MKWVDVTNKVKHREYSREVSDKRQCDKRQVSDKSDKLKY